jgi:hypothetical protein
MIFGAVRRSRALAHPSEAASGRASPVLEAVERIMLFALSRQLFAPSSSLGQVRSRAVELRRNDYPNGLVLDLPAGRVPWRAPDFHFLSTGASRKPPGKLPNGHPRESIRADRNDGRSILPSPPGE